MSPTASFQREGISVNVKQEYATIEVSSAPDPEWEYEDEEGHRHYYDEEMNLPTLEKRKTGEFWSSICRDTIETYGYFCKKCDERVRPGTHKPPPQRIPLQVDITGRVEKNSPHFDRIVQAFNGDSIDLQIGPYLIQGIRAREVAFDYCEFRAESIEIDMEAVEND